METINVVVNDSEQTYKRTEDDDELAPKVTMVSEVTAADNYVSTQKEVIVEKNELIPSLHLRKNHPSSSIIGDPSAEVTTRKKDKVDYTKMIVDLCYTSSIEPTLVNEALKARLEVVCFLLSISCIRKFKLYQMDVKSAFLNSKHQELGMND
ncbi:putative mitochondrial protein [Cucumis melo var. makuwa]|uniref:Mitochondrial protein n=1 Tax=Cucumis melo var. makuwa TaxID=1194695 RepID=A0A5A7T2X2_CUCMM|nr:putative mitochondrial protein [Cucumis melo var. makuwa]TYK27201.1 putative mitochondrial protein [Cucumis melo var. makuwa]